MRQLAFNFHNRLGFLLETRDPKCAQFFQSEFAFAVGDVDSDLPLVRLEWQGGAMNGESQGRMHATSHRLLARWRYDVQMEPREIRIRVVGNALSIPMVYHMMVHPSLRMLATEVGEILLHGAAVVFEDRSLVVTGEGGTGKTTTSSLLLDRGGPTWQLHADDYVFIAKDETTYAYLTRSHFYRKMLQWFPDFAGRLTLAERARLKVLGWLLQLSGQRVKWPVRLSPSRLWPAKEFAASAQLSAVVILARSNGASVELRSIPPAQVPVERLLKMNFSEAAHFERLVARVDGLPSDWRREWHERERAILQRLSKQARFYELKLPRRKSPDHDLGSELVRLLATVIKEGRDHT